MSLSIYLHISQFTSLFSSSLSIILMDQQSTQSYFDAHTHLLDYPHPQHTIQVINHSIAHAFKYLSVNTTTSQQYQPLIKLVQSYPHLIVPSFGVHPWFVDQQQAINQAQPQPKQQYAWLTQLKELLLQKEQYCVGQIGIDHRTVVLDRMDKQKQFDYFQKQFELGVELNRPITIHCVRAYGDLLKYLKQVNKNIKKPKYPHLIMHSYGGSKEITKSLLKLTNLNIYFSLSLRASPQICSVIPIDRLLCQTDAPCQNNIQLLEQTGCLNLNQYHLNQMQKLKELSIDLHQALHNKQLKQQLLKQSEKLPQQGLNIYKKIVDNETSQPANILASIKTFQSFYNIDSKQFSKIIFQNTCRAFKIIK